VNVPDGLEDCGTEMFEMLVVEHMKTKKEEKRRGEVFQGEEK
jgi:hypothetical protein